MSKMDFKEHLLSFLPKEEVEDLLASFNDKDTHAVLLNTKKIDDESFLKYFPNVKKHPCVEHAFIYDKDEYPLGKHIFHDLGLYYLQDPSAMVVSSLIDFKEDDFVLDLCAAPGGKSIQASLKLNDTGMIISNDLSKSRAFLLSSNVERLGLANIVITNNDFEKIYEKHLNKFDVIILDAPCSGSGMFRKDDKMIDDWSIAKVEKFAEIEKNLIYIAYQMLKPDGVLSYSTCSYSIEEDEEVIEYLLGNTDALINPIKDIKGAYINKDKPLGIRLMPNHFLGEGQYICQIKKPGRKIKTQFNKTNKYQKLFPEVLKDKTIIKYSDTYFFSNYEINTKALNVIRYGAKIGQENKNIFSYDIHFAHYLNQNDFPSLEITYEELKTYLSGNVINKNNPHKGYILLTYLGNGVNIDKSDTSTIKNHYPKGLRRNIND